MANYSITFMPDLSTVWNANNTWDNWKLIPDSPPMIPPPQPKINFLAIPGHPHGGIDLSRYPFGKLLYERVTGSWNFLYEPQSKDTRMNTYNAVRSYLHGKTMYLKLDEDPSYFYRGIITVSQPRSGTPVQLTIAFDLEPIRYKSNGTIDTEYPTK